MYYLATIKTLKRRDGGHIVKVNVERYGIGKAKVGPQPEGESDFSYRRRVLENCLSCRVYDWEMVDDL